MYKRQTYACGSISTEAQKLIDVTRQSFFEGIRFAKKGMRVQEDVYKRQGDV